MDATDAKPARREGRTMQRKNRWVALAVVVVALLLAACGGSSTADEGSGHEPAVLEAIEGSELMKITLTEEAAARIAIETATVEDGQAGSAAIAIPYAAVLYDPDGTTFTYTSPEPLVFVREPITVDRIEGEVAYLTEGPATGTAVVTVGAAELFGTELGVDH
jgi:hypothetical protein